MTWRDLVREELKGIEPYRAVTRPARICLDANESPLELPAAVRRELGETLFATPLARYPDIMASEPRALIAKDLGLAPEQLLFGNGSDEIISYLAQTFAKPPKNQSRARVCYPVPSFVMYRLGTMGAGALPLEVPLRADFTLDEVALERAIVAGQPNLLFLARPNNPTGTLWPKEAVVKIAKQHPNLIVVVDEAYFMFADEHCLDLLPHHENLVLLRTVSKIGLAALRFGVLIAHPDVVKEVEKVRAPYNVNSLSQRAVALLLSKHGGLLREGVAEVIRERERMSAALEASGAATVFASRSNFIMLRVVDAGHVFEQLLTRGIRIKNFDRPGLLANCLRVTVGTVAENDAFLAAFVETAAKLPVAAADEEAEANAAPAAHAGPES